MKKVHERNVTEYEWHRSEQSYLKLQGVLFNTRDMTIWCTLIGRTPTFTYEHSIEVGTLFIFFEVTKIMYSLYVYFWE